MKNTIYKLALSIAMVFAVTSSVHAVLVPTLSLTTTNNSTQIVLTIFGADPNASVILFYPTSSSMGSATIGTTNASGIFSQTVGPSTYNIAAGAPVYVLVNGVQSQIIAWPSVTASNNVGTGNTLTLSQTSLSMTAGQSTAVTASAGNAVLGALYIQSNTNTAVANVSISGNQVIVAANSAGSTAATVCSSGAGCASLTVNVTQPGSTQTNQSTIASTVSFSPSSVTVNAGQSQIVSVSGPGSYYINNNSSPGVVSASMSGTNLTVGGIVQGTAVIGVCSNSNNSTTCSSINVNVYATNAASTNTNNPQNTSTVTFNPTSADMSIGQTKTVTVIPSTFVTGVYYIQSNSNSSIVTANVNGSAINLSALAYGGANITVCQQGGGTCGNLYVYVSPNANGGTTAASTVSTKPLAIASLSINSNNVNNTFMGAGAALTFMWNVNQEITTKSVTVGGASLPVNGNASGPFSAIYTVTGNETLPIPVVISFSNAAGMSGGTKLSLGGAVSTTVTGNTNTSAGTTFVSYLQVGSTGGEVTALQHKLTELGFYTGPITGKFGAQTEAAVKRLQAKHGLNQLGAVGPGTRAILNQ